MAGLDGDDPFAFGFDFEDDGDGYEFCFDPFDDCGVEGGEGDEMFDGHFVVDADDGGGEEFCVSGFSFRESDGDDVLVVEDHASSRSSHEEPILETLGRSFDSNEEGFTFLPHLVSALDLAAEEEGEVIAGDDRGGGRFEFEPGRVIEVGEAGEGGDDDFDDDGIGFVVSGFEIDPRSVTGGFQTLVDANDEVTGDDDMGEEGGFVLSGFDLRPPQAAGTFRMVVDAEDTDSDAADFFEELITGRVGAAGLPASPAAVAGLPEVVLSEEEASHGCAVCKDGIVVGVRALRLPCKHYFHGECIRPWLAIKNTCPVCRFELPTGDAEYDRRRSRIAVGSVAQQGTPAQSGGTVGAEAAAGCPGENRPEQGASC